MGCANGTTYVQTISQSSRHRIDGVGRSSACFVQRFELRHEIGSGQYGKVYSISDSQKEFSDDELVVKVVDLRSGLALQHTSNGFSQRGKDTGEVHQIKKEIKILRMVSEVKYCVKLVDHFLDNNFCYLVMERCDINFYSLLCGSRDLNERTFVPIAHDMFAGLAAIHDLGIVHRDVKPDNFVFNSLNKVTKLCDFGLSECLTKEKPYAFGLNGTVPFMSPEMLSGVFGYTEQTDMWSIGVILYVLFLGQFHFIPARKDIKAMKDMIISGLPAPSFRSALVDNGNQPSLAFIKLLHKLLSRNPLTRVTATCALNDEWLIVSPTCAHGTYSLQPFISSAVRAGAFSMNSYRRARLALAKSVPKRSRTRSQESSGLEESELKVTEIESTVSTRPSADTKE